MKKLLEKIQNKEYVIGKNKKRDKKKKKEIVGVFGCVHEPYSRDGYREWVIEKFRELCWGFS